MAAQFAAGLKEVIRLRDNLSSQSEQPEGSSVDSDGNRRSERVKQRTIGEVLQSAHKKKSASRRDARQEVFSRSRASSADRAVDQDISTQISEVDEDLFDDPKKFHTLQRVIDVLGLQVRGRGSLHTRGVFD